MLLPCLVTAGLLAAGSPDVPLLSQEGALAQVELAPEVRIKPGMTENQVERLLEERAGGTIEFGGCGTCRPAANYAYFIRIYKRSGVMVSCENGRASEVRSLR